MYCLETTGLTYEFSARQRVLDHVNIQISEGSIYGFLGPNGAGKTTTLKLILGLLKIQRGEISVFGKAFLSNRIEALRRIGSMIESPSIYQHLTASENLEILRKIYGCPKNRILEVLKLVGLEKTGSKRAAHFSLGMKQRLSFAIALLHSPSMLILDEPTNGLDPNGILEIRGLLKNLNKERGITILISSHLLSEIEKLVTHVGIINHGKLLFQGTLGDLMNKRQQNSAVVFETNDAHKTSQIIRNLGVEARIEAGKVLTPVIDKERIAFLNRTLVQNDLEIYKIAKIESDLENIFFDVLNG